MEIGNNMKLEDLELLPNLPNYFHPTSSEQFPEELLGAEIVAIGTSSEADLLEGGGLIIDYRKPSDRKVYRIVFSFNANGMWIEFNGLKS